MASTKDHKMIAGAHQNNVEQDASSCGDATKDNAQYLDELLSDMRAFNGLKGAFPLTQRLITQEIDRVWRALYQGGVTSGKTIPPLMPTVLPSVTVPPPLFASSSTAASLYNPSQLCTVPILRDTFTPTKPRTSSHHENILAIQRAYAALVGSHFSPFEGGVTVQEKIPIPYYPRCNFIGRILGPRGISVKQIESETGCNILIRGHGSVKDPMREARLLNHPGWEHLAEPLHVLIKADDVSQASAEVKLRRGVEAVSKLLSPTHDEHKRLQMVQLAIINGTYRCDGADA